MRLTDRILIFSILFDDLQSTTSRIEKGAMIAQFKSTYRELQEDLTMILETLDGRHPIGWTFVSQPVCDEQHDFDTIKDVIIYLKSLPDRTQYETVSAEAICGKIVGKFIEPIVNRTLRLGIGHSLLSKTDYTPMLAKKYEGQMLHNDVIVTEKLDGNRCVAFYDQDQQKWQFKSRSGKPLNVDFDMSDMPKEFIYDGEIMSIVQTKASIDRTFTIFTGVTSNSYRQGSLDFNKTSGLINRKGSKTGLIYNIFDVISDMMYKERRKLLNSLPDTSTERRIIPELYTGTDTSIVNDMLDVITSMGGEGIMLNVHNRKYENKRSDALLKYKQVQYCDMFVLDTFEGKGKYEGMCGGISCYMRTEDGKDVRCDVGSGLSDIQREEWGINNREIIGKIVEIAYHELTQDQYNRGTNLYSLRFPRLKRIRSDKNVTSEY